jgi:hypothetical protein
MRTNLRTLDNQGILVLVFTVFCLYMALANLLNFLSVISLPLQAGFNNELLLILVGLDILSILQYGAHRRGKETALK